MEAANTLGIDLGGTTFSVGVVDTQGAISGAHEQPTLQHDGPERLLPRLAQAAREVLESSGANCEAVGIGVPGPVKHRDGICVYAPNLDGWRDLPVAAPLSEQIGLPTFVINDAKATTIAE